jgi:hypothetical protein
VSPSMAWLGSNGVMRCPLLVIDGVESPASPAMSAMPRWRTKSASQRNDAMCQKHPFVIAAVDKRP